MNLTKEGSAGDQRLKPGFKLSVDCCGEGAGDCPTCLEYSIGNDQKAKYKQCLDLESVLLHELGHVMGFDESMPLDPKIGDPHPDTEDEVMNPFYCGQKRELKRRDQCLVCIMYCSSCCLNCPLSDLRQQYELNNKDFTNVFIYPDPANKLITIQYVSLQNLTSQLELYNITGVEMRSMTIKPTGDKNHLINIDTENLRSGTYYLVIKNSDSFVFKLLLLLK